MTMLLDERLRDLATQTHLLETKVSSLGWMAGAGAQTLKSMTRAQAHLMLAECGGCLIVCVWDHLIERKRSW